MERLFNGQRVLAAKWTVCVATMRRVASSADSRTLLPFSPDGRNVARLWRDVGG